MPTKVGRPWRAGAPGDGTFPDEGLLARPQVLSTDRGSVPCLVLQPRHPQLRLGEGGL